MNLTSLTALFQGLDVPIKIGLFTSTREQFWQNVLPASTMTRMGTSGS